MKKVGKRITHIVPFYHFRKELFSWGFALGYNRGMENQDPVLARALVISKEKDKEINKLWRWNVGLWLAVVILAILVITT